MMLREVTFWLILLTLTVAALIFVVLPSVHKKFNTKVHWVVTVVFIFSLPLGGFTLYWQLGGWHLLERTWQQEHIAALANKQVAKAKNPQQVLAQLKSYLNEHPKAAKGWFLLGTIYLNHHDYNNAAQALAKATHAQPKNLNYQTRYVEALFFVNQHRLPSMALVRLTQVLRKDPGNIDAINLLAIDCYNRQRYQQAIAWWEKLARQFPVQSGDARLIYSMIAKAQKKLQK